MLLRGPSIALVLPSYVKPGFERDARAAHASVSNQFRPRNNLRFKA